ncbi:hypothetical protein T484DRAFT_1896902, partial [Baffinella frigidus]
MSFAGEIVSVFPKGGYELSEERGFQALRRQLADEGFVEALHSESLPLVKRLFDDFSALRETKRALEATLNDKTANESRMQRQMHPLQKELGRMVRENNQLHLELITRGEEFHAYQQKDTLKFKALEGKLSDSAFVIAQQGKLSDSTFVIAQQAQHIRELERQLDEHRDRMQQLLDPHMTCTSGPTGDVQPKYRDRMQQQLDPHMTCSSGPTGDVQPKGALITKSCCPRPPDAPIVVDGGRQQLINLESAATEQIEGLQRDAVTLQELKAEVLAENEALKYKVQGRDEEIVRMGKLLVVNVNSDKEDLERQNEEQTELIRRLQNQLDFLSGQLTEAASLTPTTDDQELIRRLQNQLDFLSGQLTEAEERKHVYVQLDFLSGQLTEAEERKHVYVQLESVAEMARAREMEATRRLAEAEDEVADLRVLLQRAADGAAGGSSGAGQLRGARAVPSQTLEARRGAGG